MNASQIVEALADGVVGQDWQKMSTDEKVQFAIEAGVEKGILVSMADNVRKKVKQWVRSYPSDQVCAVAARFVDTYADRALEYTDKDMVETAVFGCLGCAEAIVGKELMQQYLKPLQAYAAVALADRIGSRK